MKNDDENEYVKEKETENGKNGKGFMTALIVIAILIITVVIVLVSVKSGKSKGPGAKGPGGFGGPGFGGFGGAQETSVRTLKLENQTLKDFVITNGELGDDNKLLIRYDLPT